METSEEVQQFLSKLDSMPVDELKKELASRNLDITGSKAVVRERLRKACITVEEERNCGRQRRLKKVTDKDETRRESTNGGCDENEDGETEEEKIEDEDGIDVDSMKLKELKSRLKSLNLKTTGNKTQLKSRLKKALEEDEEEDETSDDETELKMAVRQARNSTRRGPYKILQNRGQNVEIKSTLSYKDVEDALDSFSGDDGKNIKLWIREFEDMADLCEWTDIQKTLYARRLLKGSARLFISFEENKYSWKQIRTALIEEFGMRVDSHTIHEKLRLRKKEKNESYQEYCYRMLEIAAHADVEVSSVIQYIIDGIEGDVVSKSVLYGAQDMRELKRKLIVFDKIMSKNVKPKRLDNVKVANQFKNKDEKNCFNCGKRGHISKHCPDKGRGLKCFKCSCFGHKAVDCSKQNKDKDCNIVQENVNKCFKDVEINGVKGRALIDTGSDLSFIRADIFVKIGAPTIRKNIAQFCGIGSGKMSTLGQVAVNLAVDGNDFNVTMHIVPEGILQYELLLGVDFLRHVEVNLKGGEVTISSNNTKNENNVFEICALKEINKVEVSHIENQIIREQVEHCIVNYRPNKTKDVDIKVDIILKDDEPIFQRPRRLAVDEKREVDKQINTWLKEGIIRPSISEYASPIVLVKKKNGSTRICIDYRKLNFKIIKNRYPLPIIEDQINRLQGARVFTTLDLKNGFFHVAISENSCKYTSFVIPDGQYEFLRLPFGLCVSPAYFQRYVNIIFKDLTAKGIVTLYMDDIIIASQDYEEGLRYLELVLKVASEYGLLFNWEKCNIMRSSVQFLGYTICNGMVKPSEEKTRAVRDFPVPRNVKEVQSFLGLVGFFRKFIRNFSIIARPLTNLTKTDVIFKFDDDERKAFDELKHALCNEPVLRLYDPTAETELHTDASSYGFGAILLQRDSEDRQLHPIHYASWKTTEAESNYDSYKLEVLAVVRALKKFRVYLIGLQFKIKTDCQAFVQTMKKKDISAQVARWALYLEDFRYELEHRSGSRMKHVDALSRSPIFTTLLADVSTEGTCSKLRRNQQEDEQLRKIMDQLQKGEVDGYLMDNGLLCKIVGGDALIVVPQDMQTSIIQQYHNQGHFAVEKTEQLIRREFWFDQMRQKIQRAIDGCISCVLAERKKGKMEGFLNPIEKGDSPFGTFHLDHIGPLPSTKKSYKHILVVIDAFTKFVWLYPTKSTGTAEVIDRLVTQSAVFGHPGRIVTDRGVAFTSSEFKEYCQSANIEHTLIVTGIPRGNGQVERLNRTLIPLLTKLSAPHPDQWYKHVAKAQQFINHVPSRSTGVSPFMLLFGTKMRLTEDPRVREIIEEECESWHIQKRDEIRSQAKRSIEKIQAENRAYYNRKRKKASTYQEGSVVAIQRTQTGPGQKFSNKFLGPYEVSRVLRNDRYVVKKLGQGDGPRVTSTAADHMKPWV